jgi:two-component system phosphate regulon response regulator PhoB
MAPLILIVDDEKDLVDTLDYNLTREGFETRVALSGHEALEAARTEPTPDLILLDIMLPDIPGTDVCRQLRQDDRLGRIPVVMLTAKGEEIDRVVGFEIGADDYVTKPFSVRELMLRIKAILRRAEPVEEAAPAREFGRLRIDRQGHHVWVDAQEVTLTALEFKLLTTLLERKGRVQSREQLLDEVWGIQASVTTRTVDTHVKRLRQKIGAAAAYIETLRGVGYRFRSAPPE